MKVVELSFVIDWDEYLGSSDERSFVDVSSTTAGCSSSMDGQIRMLEESVVVDSLDHV